MIELLLHSPEVYIGFGYDSLVGNSTLLPANDIPTVAPFATEIIQKKLNSVNLLQNVQISETFFLKIMGRAGSSGQVCI